MRCRFPRRNVGCGVLVRREGSVSSWLPWVRTESRLSSNPWILVLICPNCKKRAAARRNQRISLGHRRLHRARAVPCSRWRKTRLILSGIWPQCLHGAETCQVPRSVYKRLRTQAGRVASLAKPGVSPWLARSVGAMQTVDPAFCLLVQRIRLFRLMWRISPWHGLVCAED